MNDLGGRRQDLLADVLRAVEQPAPRQPARLRAGTIVTAAALLLAGGVTFTALPALMHRTPAATGGMTSAVAVAHVVPAATPTPMSTPTPAMAAPPRAAMATAAPPAVAGQLVVGPGAMHGFTLTGTWNADTAGSPGFTGPDRWVANGAGTAQWSLGTPGGGRGWDQVRVATWIPSSHAQAWVRYTVASTVGGVATTRSFDVSQQALNGWYTLPGTFATGTATQRTGTITVTMTYLRPYPPTATNGGCEMGAAQMRFQWS